MLKRKTMTNLEIYNIANNLIGSFTEELNLPVKVNFYLQKNINSIVEQAKEIDAARTKILEKYGTINEENQQYTFTDNEKVIAANAELEDLFSLEQEVKVNLLKIDWFDDTNLTSSQVAAIMYMIEDEEE